MSIASPRRAAAALLVLLLHLGLLAALLFESGLRRTPAPSSASLRWLPLRPPAKPAIQAPVVAPAGLRAGSGAVRPSAPAQPGASQLAAEAAAPATEAALPAQPPPLDLRPAPDGPRRRQALGVAGALAEQLRSDPRSHSPRLGLQERMAVALGTPCFVDEVDAEGRVQRHEGRWAGSADLAQQISHGVANNIGVGGKAPARLAYRCERAR